MLKNVVISPHVHHAADADALHNPLDAAVDHNLSTAYDERRCP